MDRSFDTKLIVNLAQAVAEQVAPEERRHFPSISRAYQEKPKGILPRKRLRDTMGFGPAAPAKQKIKDSKELGLDSHVKDLLTPKIFLTLHQVFFLSDLSKKGFDTSHRENGELHPPDFSSEELARIQEAIFETAGKNGFEDEEAELFANIVVERLDITRTLGEEI